MGTSIARPYGVFLATPFANLWIRRDSEWHGGHYGVHLTILTPKRGAAMPILSHRWAVVDFAFSCSSIVPFMWC